MASLQELERALVAADAAGNTDDARVFANEIRQMRSNQGPQGMDFSQPLLSPENRARALAYRESLAPPEEPGMIGSFVREAEVLYWIAGCMVLVIAFILLRKWLKTSPWRVIPQAVRSAAKMKDKMMFDLSDQDAEWFAAAEEELVSGNIHKATWARALVKAGGNEEKRRVDYILLRVKKMRLGES